ncbi:MAG: DNA polymerase III subunit beta [Tannerellaceae bacterium]|jgi:DNA polymerase-3 subunit beta|nr:DNA polymerase III subunit beta [Tannerellaceae bacterium]
MKFSVSKSELLSRLQDAGRIISKKPVTPLMSCFLLRTTGERLYISAADASGRIDTSIECAADEKGEVCIESGMIINAMKELPEQPVIFRINTVTLNVRVDYQGGRFEMAGKDPALFPEPKGIHNAREITLPAESLFDGLQKTAFCAADDFLRPIVNGVFIESGDTGVNYVATDGHRLAVVEHLRDGMPKLSFVLPAQAVSVLKSIVQRYAEEVSITLGRSNVKFEAGDFQIVSVPQEGKYPNYRSVIPKENDKTAVIETQVFKDAISRVSLFSNDSKLVILEFSADTLKVTASDVDYSMGAEETVACEYKGIDFSIGVNGALMYEALSRIACDRSVFSFSEPAKPILIKPEDRKEGEDITYLQMPVSINY